MRYGFGIDLGGTTVKLAFFDETGTMLHKWEIPTVTENAGAQILPDIAAAVNGYLKDREISREAVLGIGIGVPGPVLDSGIVDGCSNLGWGKIPVAQQLEALTGLPVKAGNDASVAALGECWKGSGQGCENLLLATLGTGVGGGIVINGKLINGVHGCSGEIGHVMMNRHETRRCGCGKCGCAEQYCSATGIVTLAKDKLQATDAPSALREVPKITSKAVFDAGNAGDPVALEIMEQYFAYLGEFLASLTAVVDPEVIVLGGGVSKAGQVLVDGATKYYKKLAFGGTESTPIAIATLGNDAGAYGAFKLVLSAFG